MEPIPETAEAIQDYGPFVIEEDDLSAELMVKAQQVQTLVPRCVGISVASNQDGLTFTLASTATEIAVLDAVQYLAGGPCVEAVKAERILAYDHEGLLNEGEWQLFAQATSARNIASTLSLVILEAGVVAGGVNLYADTPHAFDGHHEAIAEIFGAWAPGAVTNADLSFRTRDTAERAPQILREGVDLSVAWSITAAREGIDLETARVRLTQAAQRARVSEAQLARILIELTENHDAE